MKEEEEEEDEGDGEVEDVVGEKEGGRGWTGTA
jgi:hypothetical protein